MTESSKRIAELIRHGKKIEAIKLLRETTGLDLKRAKEEVERLSVEMAGQEPSPVVSHPSRESGSGQVSKEVADLARQGRKIEAIKLLREQTGMGLKAAKETVEKMDGSRGGGCLSAVLLSAVLLGVVLLEGILSALAG